MGAVSRNVTNVIIIVDYTSYDDDLDDEDDKSFAIFCGCFGPFLACFFAVFSEEKIGLGAKSEYTL